jgi:nucleoside 2-deoxyribosyltransferase
MLSGVRLSWEERKQKNIYIAAPDFPDVDKTHLDKLCECLRYHNFNIHLPIEENGLVTNNTDINDEMIIFGKDMNLLNNCDLLIAVLLFNDPGTLIEAGIFIKSQKPVIIFDPYNICHNMFVRNSAKICNKVEDVIQNTFEFFSRR